MSKKTLGQFRKEFLFDIKNVTKLDQAKDVARDILAHGKFERGPNAEGSGNIVHTMGQLHTADMISDGEYIKAVDDALKLYKRGK